MKAAETDATKRALATFGKPFGLALYGNGHPARARWGAESSIHSHRSATPEIGTARAATVGSAAVIEKSGCSNADVSVGAPTSAAHSSLSEIAGRIDKSLLTFGAPRRERDRDHLLFVARQPCLICSRIPSDAHHLRFAQPTSMGRKVGDQFVVPLCRTHHRQLHESHDEARWWDDLEIGALEIAKGLWEQSRAKRAELVRAIPGAIDPVAPSTLGATDAPETVKSANSEAATEATPRRPSDNNVPSK
ncbi:MAG: DUF968 domain-containing protein [Xanthobacteraceae bacterium]|nr:DUF968 domain-containing protein [Xanthobacteraceae bacterium]